MRTIFLNRKGFAPILLFLIIVGFVALGGGVYFYQKKITTEKEKTAEKQAVEAVSPTPPPSPQTPPPSPQSGAIAHPKILSVTPDHGTLLDQLTIRGEGFDIAPGINQVHLQSTDGTFVTVTAEAASTDGQTIIIVPCGSKMSEQCRMLQGVSKKLRVFVTRASDNYTSEATEFLLVDSSGDVVAQNLITIDANKTFSLADFSDVQFKVRKVYKATGGVPVSPAAPCGLSPGPANTFIFLKYLMPGASPSGLCFDVENSAVEGGKASLVVVDLETNNNSPDDTNGTFLQLFYNVTVDGKQTTRLAKANPPWSSYGATMLSSRRILLGFEVPLAQDEFQLIFGNYGEAGRTRGEDFFSKSDGGFIVNFKTKTISDIPG